MRNKGAQLLEQSERQRIALLNESYGELKNCLHNAGYSYERGCQRLRMLLANDGWKECGVGFGEVDSFLSSLQLDQFAKLTEEKREIAKLIKELRPDVSNRAIGRALKTPETTMRQFGAGGQKKPNENNERMRHDGASASGAQAAAVVARHERVKRNQETVEARVEKAAMDAGALGKFSLILADPPWDDEFGRSTRSIENHYPTMRFDDILALPVEEIAHEQAMLFLWATPSMIEMAFSTIRAWGFEYRTQMVWVKPSIGLGKYVRQRHELLLICRRGAHPAPPPKTLPDSVIEAPRGEHSAKPEIFHEIIERMFPTAAKIELFRRGAPRQSWTAWGAETAAAE